MADSGAHGPSLDHVVPKSDGGLHRPHNTLIVCIKCNNDKKALTLENWSERLRKGGDPRYLVVFKLIEARKTAADFASEGNRVLRAKDDNGGSEPERGHPALPEETLGG